MSEVKLPPGPWYVVDGVYPGGGIGIGPELEGIGPHTIVTYNGGDSEARAILIAASPKMLGALRLALRYLEHPDVQAASSNFVISGKKAGERIREAIAQATGKK